LLFSSLGEKAGPLGAANIILNGFFQGMGSFKKIIVCHKSGFFRMTEHPVYIDKRMSFLLKQESKKAELLCKGEKWERE